jgi:hypothetical protein
MYKLARNVPQNARNDMSARTVFRLNTLDLPTIVIICIYIQCDNASFKHFAGSVLSSLSHTKHPQSSFPKFTETGRQSLLINKSFNCNILLELVFLGTQDRHFWYFVKIISVILGIFVDLYQGNRIPRPPLADPFECNGYSLVFT